MDVVASGCGGSSCTTLHSSGRSERSLAKTLSSLSPECTESSLHRSVHLSEAAVPPPTGAAEPPGAATSVDAVTAGGSSEEGGLTALGRKDGGGDDVLEVASCCGGATRAAKGVPVKRKLGCACVPPVVTPCAYSSARATRASTTTRAIGSRVTGGLRCCLRMDLCSNL